MEYYISIASVFLFLTVHSSQSFLLRGSSSTGGLTRTASKRLAWMPQGRMGKRDQSTDITIPMAKRAAWVQQTRFGKRLSDNDDYGSFLDAMQQDTMFEGTGIMPEEVEKRNPRMGLYLKRSGPRLSLPERPPFSQYAVEGADNQDGKTNVKGIFHDGQAPGDMGRKRAAWVPQGRFGKRSLKGKIHNIKVIKD